MEKNVLFEERMGVLQDCINFRHTSRIPHFSNFFTWKILDSDLKPKLSEALKDYGMLDQIQTEFQERYNFDVHYDLLARNLLKPSDIMGGEHHMIDDVNESINFYDHAIMEAEEYPEYKTDRFNVVWKMFNRKYPDVEIGTIINAMIEFNENAAYNPYMKKKFLDNYGCPSAYGPIAQVPYERFHKYFRGIKNGSLDLRRKKADMLDCFEQMMEDEIMPGLKASLAADTSTCFTDIMVPLLSHTMMNTKQWETFYWPYLKRILDEIQASGKTVMIYVENSLVRLKEYFQDYPKGFLVLVPELDDVRDLRAAVPNACIVGGMPTSLLGRGTKEQCVDHVKKVIDEMGDGFILGQDKMVSFRNDCTRENLLAVCDYVQKFRW